MRGLSALLLAVALLGCSKEQPDIFVITVDTLRGDAVSAYSGRGSTPNMDALIASGTYFPNTITTMPRTTPAVASLMTGLYPPKHGSLEVGQKVTHGKLLAEHFRNQGYITIGLSANAAASHTHGLAAGFDVFIDRKTMAEALGDRLWQDTNYLDRGNASVGWAQALTEAALAQVANVDADTPIFLWLLYMDPHALYAPPPGTEQPESPECHALYTKLLSSRGNPALAMAGLDPDVPAALEQCKSLYLAEAAYADHWIGILREGLSERSLPAFTILTADHGENFGEEGLYFEHGFSLMNASLRVPLVFHGPGVPAGVRSGRSASLVDVAPTIRSLADLPDFPADGTDLFAPCNASCRARPLFALGANSVSNFHFDRTLTGLVPGRVCANAGSWTLCRQYTTKTQFDQETLFDREATGKLNMRVNRPEIRSELAEQFERWPPMSARDLAVVMGQRKLVLRPLPEGGYSSTTYAFGDKIPESRLDISEADLEVLERELAWWATGVEYDEIDQSQVAVLRSLGYLQ